MSGEAQYQMKIPCLTLNKGETAQDDFWVRGWIIGFTTIENPLIEVVEKEQEFEEIDTGKVFNVPGAIIKEKNSSHLRSCRFMLIMAFENEEELEEQIKKDKLSIYEKKN